MVESEPQSMISDVPLPGMPPVLIPEKGRYAWQPAFIAYCKGFTLEQISGSMGIPLRTLENRALDEHWASLAAELPLKKSARADYVGKAALHELEANRQKNLKVFENLREELVEVISKLRDGQLRVERLFFSAKTGVVVRETQEPGPSDLVSLATAAKTVAEGTYRALGDASAADNSKQVAPPATITFLLPGIVANSPSQRDPVSDAKEAQVVDLRGST